MQYDLVLEGGGAKGMAFVGAMREFEAAGHTIGRIIGSSAGAITAVSLAAGYTGNLLPLWIAFGFFGTASTLSYAILSQAFPPTLAGRVNTAFNLLVFVAAFLMQWGLGAVIGLWPRTAAGGYAPAGYSAGFGLVVALQVAAMGWFWYAGAGSNRRIRFSRQPGDSTV